VPGLWVKWVYAALAVGQLGAVLAIRSAVELALARRTMNALIMVADRVFAFAILGLALAWIYCAWLSLPAAARKDVSPGGAVGRFFIPCYNAFWVFIFSAKLCHALDALAVEAGERRRAPLWLAILAGVLTFVPGLLVLDSVKAYAFVVIAVSHALWWVYMLQCDALRGALLRARISEVSAWQRSAQGASP